MNEHLQGMTIPNTQSNPQVYGSATTNSEQQNSLNPGPTSYQPVSRRQHLAPQTNDPVANDILSLAMND